MRLCEIYSSSSSSSLFPLIALFPLVKYMMVGTNENKTMRQLRTIRKTFKYLTL